MDEYIAKAKELAEWLREYKSVSLAPREITASITAIRREANRSLKKASVLTKLDIMVQIDGYLNVLFHNDPQFFRMLEMPKDVTPEYRLHMWQTTEVHRFNKIMEMGYHGVYRVADDGKVRQKFVDGSRSMHITTRLQKGLALVRDLIGDINTTQLPEELLSLYALSRDMEYLHPTIVQGRAYTLSDRYPPGGTQPRKDAYLRNFAKLKGLLEELYEHFGGSKEHKWVEFNDNPLISEVEHNIYIALDMLSEIYSTLMFHKITSVL